MCLAPAERRSGEEEFRDSRRVSVDRVQRPANGEQKAGHGRRVASFASQLQTLHLIPKAMGK